MRIFRSRLSTVEERKNMSSAYKYLLFSVFFIIFFIFFGIPVLTKITGLIGDLKKSDLPVEINDNTPPAPPQINPLPEATNKNKLEIKGSAEEGATIRLFINNTEETVIADKNGAFSFSTILNKGENTISLLAKDASENESTSTPDYLVIYDDKEPELEISSPQDGQSFYGSLQRQIVIEGKTEAGASITINDRIVVVEQDGSFAYAISLQEGDNNFNIKSTDKAGNQIVKGITLHYWK